jgi:hypothetical protein
VINTNKQLEWKGLLKGVNELTLNVSGDCMQTVLAEGTSIKVARAKCYWPGDVVVFPNAGQLMVHRVIGLYRRNNKIKVLTQADRGLHPDKAVLLSEIVGKVITTDELLYRVTLVDRLWSVLRFLHFVFSYYISRAVGFK